MTTVNASVEKRKGEGIESMIGRFRRKVQKSGILQEFRERSEFVKPSDKKRRSRRSLAFNG